MKAYMDRVMAPKLEELGLVPSSAPFICEIARSEGIIDGTPTNDQMTDLHQALSLLRHLQRVIDLHRHHGGKV